MRIAILTAAAFALWLPAAANAAAPAATAVAPATQAGAIEQVAVHCGQHAHYVKGHRNSHGHYIKGHCVRDHEHEHDRH